MNQAILDVRDRLASWAPHRDLLTFAHALYDAAEFDRIEHVLLFFEKPYNWHREYTAWKSIGKPVGPGDDGWGVFLAGLNALSHAGVNAP